MLFDNELLDKVYQDWYYGNESKPRWPKTFRRERGNYRNNMFEDWLFDKGFTIIQKDKKLYLKFFGDEKKLTFFLLKYVNK